MTTTNPTVPHRFSRSSFDRYSPYIALAIKEYPGCIIIDPSSHGLSVETFACRFRDAVAAWGEHGYSNDTLSTYNPMSCAKDLVVSIHKGKVIIGSRLSIRDVTKPKPIDLDPTVQTPSNNNEIHVSKNPIFLRMLCDMVSHQTFSPQPRFVVRGLEIDEVEKLNRDYDVSVVEDETEKGKFYIL